MRRQDPHIAPLWPHLKPPTFPRPPVRHSAEVQRRPMSWTVLSYDQEPSCLLHLNGWLQQLPPDASGEQLGAACIQALAHSRDGASEEDRLIGWQLLGYRDNSAYLTLAKAVSLSMLPGYDSVKITALVRQRRGLEVISPLRQLTGPAGKPAGLGAAVERAFRELV